jgi:plasmid maintenance system antidote protein VapI
MSKLKFQPGEKVLIPATIIRADISHCRHYPYDVRIEGESAVFEDNMYIGDAIKQQSMSPHPGEHLLECICAKEDRSLIEIICDSRIPEQEWLQMLRGHAPLTEAMAFHISKIIGGSATFWMNLQEEHVKGGGHE